MRRLSIAAAVFVCLTVGAIYLVHLATLDRFKQQEVEDMLASEDNELPAATPAVPEPAAVQASTTIATPAQASAQNPETIAALVTTPPEAAAFGEAALGSACALPATEEVTEAKADIVYSWRDANGKLHFSDRPSPTGPSERYTTDLPSQLEFFTLGVEYRGLDNVPFFRDQLTVQATGINRILADLVGVAYLRKVDLNIVVFPDFPAYLQYANTLAQRNMATTAGFYSTVTNEAVTYVQAEHDRTLEVARHEATHVIARGFLGQIPMWLNEGLAEYFSHLSIRGQSSQITVHEHTLQLARSTLASGYPRSLQDFMGLVPEAWRGPAVSNHYALAWGLIYFLMSDESGRHALTILLREHASQYCRNIDSTAMLHNAYPGGMPALQRDYFAWLQDDSAKTPHVY